MAESTVLLMGVSGSGKTTIGKALAERTGWPFVDADDLHTEANKEKMHAGIPLTDADRWPWLELVAAWITQRRSAGEVGLVACSALRRSYRDVLRAADPDLHTVYLKVAHDVLSDRLTHRPGHFFSANLLNSQLALLEEPGPDENTLVIQSGQSIEQTVQEILLDLAR